MTEVKSISITDVVLYDKLNEITPANMNFSKQVLTAVESYVKSQDIDEVDEAPRPDFLCEDIQEWKTYFANHPERIGEIMRRHVQLKNLLLKEEHVIR
jgi:hypothetical protein